MGDNTGKYYRTKEGLLFFSASLLFLSGYFSFSSEAATAHWGNALSIPLSISEKMTPVSFFFVATLALVFYVYVEWCRLDTSEKKGLRNWTFPLFESWGVFALYCRYPEVFKDTPYALFSPLWFLPFIAVGYLWGMSFSWACLSVSLKRPKDEAKRKHLSRFPSQAKRFLVRNALIVAFILIPTAIVSFRYYPGPAYWVPCMLFLISFLSAIRFKMIFYRPSPIVKKIVDSVDRMEEMAQMSTDPKNKKILEELNESGLSAKDLQKRGAGIIGKMDSRDSDTIGISFQGPIPGTAPEVYALERQFKDGTTRRFEVEKSKVDIWIAMSRKLLAESGIPFGQKQFEEFAPKWIIYIGDEILAREQGGSLLMGHIMKRIDEDLELIILVDPDINEQFHGYTPLLEATADGFSLAVDLLIKHGADLEIASNLGATPFLMAARYDNAALLTKLKNAGANIHATDAIGNDALMTAALYNCKKVAPLLIEWGLDVHRKNYYQCGALEIALKTKSGEIATLIRRKMRGEATSTPPKGSRKRKHK